MTENSHDPDKPDSGVPSGEEPSAGVLPPSNELEDAMRAATESLDSRGAEKAGGAGGATSADKVTIEALSDELRGLTETHTASLDEIEQLKDKHLRLQAEFDNFRRRGLKERDEAFRFGHQNIVKDLLPTVDNLERAVAHARENSDADLQSLLQGVELVLGELLGVLERHGVTRIEATGEAFDPAVHEAMAQVPHPTLPANSVLEELQKGYQLYNRMLRPARVVVSKETDEGEQGEG